MGMYRIGPPRRPSAIRLERSNGLASTRQRVKAQSPAAPFANVRVVGTESRFPSRRLGSRPDEQKSEAGHGLG